MGNFVRVCHILLCMSVASVAGASSSSAPNEKDLKPTEPHKHRVLASAYVQYLPPRVIVDRLHKGTYDFAKGPLAGANLNKQDLSGVNLEKADLRHIKLAWATLKDAKLGGANLEGAQLYHANFKGANLRGANLKDAQTWGANFSGADLSGAIVSEIHFAHAVTDENTKKVGMIVIPAKAR